MSELAKPIQLDAGLIFSGAVSGRLISGYDKPTAFTPAQDPDYVFHESSRDVIVWLMNPSDPLYVFGPTGSGKTSLIKQLAARLNYPVFEVTGHGRLEFNDLVGHLSLKDGNMEYAYGPLSLAMRHGGIFLINELDLLEPSTAAGFNSILDGAPLCIPEHGGELITPHPMFRFAATANTNGGSDETGLYQGTLRQNLAFLDRFWLCEVDYPPKAAEARLLAQKFPQLPEGLRTTMIEFAREVRKLFVSEEQSIEITFSTRTLLCWADLSVRFEPLAKQGIAPLRYALDRALGFRGTPQSRAALHELAQRMFQPIHGG